MTIIPKSQIDAANELRLALTKRKHEFAGIIIANEATLGDSFVGTAEQVASVQDESLKSQLEAAFNACEAAAEAAGAKDAWVRDMPAVIKSKREAINKAEKGEN